MAPVLGVPLTSAGCLTGDACSRRCSGLAFPHRSSWAWGVKVQPPVSWLGRFQDYFRAAVVESYGAVNLDEVSLREAAHVANISKIRCENNQRERTRRLLFAEADEVDSFCSGLHAQDFTRNAFGFAEVLGGFVNGETVGS